MIGARLIDERYLTVHPRTALWWVQRETCGKCVHSHEDGDTTTGRRTTGTHVSVKGMRCSRQEQASRKRDGGGRLIEMYCMYCIDAREAGAECGPAARLFISTKQRETA